MVVQTLGAGVDLGLTEWAISTSHGQIREGNPWGGTKGARIGLKVGQVVVVGAITHKLERMGKRKAARGLRWGGVALQVGLGAWHVRQRARAR